jgi:23S rRNA (pseudouridine1915-N3)-methyltransferase
MIYCAFVGTFREKRFQQMTEEYHKRLGRLWPVTIITLTEKPKEILKFIDQKKNKGILVSLDAHGEKMDSARFIGWVTQSPQDLYFFAWGADGPPEETKTIKMKSLSLSPMTYSHELARVLLLEQLYRSGATLKGHPYPR